MTEPTPFDPASALQAILGALFGPSSWVVWLLVIVNGVVGWVVLTHRAASSAAGAAKALSMYRSRIPAILVVAVGQSFFMVSSAMIALQVGEAYVLDQQPGPDLDFLGGNFAVARTSIAFWAIVGFNALFWVLSWVGEDALNLVIYMFVVMVLASGIVVALDHVPSSVVVHGVYVAAAAFTGFLTRKLIPE